MFKAMCPSVMRESRACRFTLCRSSGLFFSHCNCHTILARSCGFNRLRTIRIFFWLIVHLISIFTKLSCIPAWEYPSLKVKHKYHCGHDWVPTPIMPTPARNQSRTLCLGRLYFAPMIIGLEWFIIIVHLCKKHATQSVTENSRGKKRQSHSVIL